MSTRYSQGVAGIFFSTRTRLLSCRFTGSRWDILLNGIQNIVQQIHRESLGYSSQRVPDYYPVDSEGFAGSFFSTGSRLIVQQIHRESLGYSSQRVQDYCPVDSQGVAVSFFSTGSRLMSSRYSQGVAVSFFSTGSRLLSCRFTGSRWIILLNGFQTIVQQVLRDSLGHSSQRVHGYCPVDSQGVAGLFFSTGSRLFSSIFSGSRWASQRLPDYCQVDSQGDAGLFSSPGSRLMSSRYSQGVAGIFFSTGSRLLSSRFTGSRWVILLSGFKTIVQQIHRESLCHSSQRVLD